MFARSLILTIIVGAPLVCAPLAVSQQVPADQQPLPPGIGQMLNRIDKPSAWPSQGSYAGSAPSGMQNFGNSTQPNTGFNNGYQPQMNPNMGVNNGFSPAPAQPGWQAPQYPLQNGQIKENQWAGNGAVTNLPANQSQQLMQVNGQPTMRALFPGIFNPRPAQAQQTQAPQGNPFSPQNILKVFMGGGDAPKDPQQALSQAREDLQTARDQCSQARGDASSVNGTRERDSKQSYAESARYHAQAAREAADRAWNCAQSSGSSQVNDVASQARGAADEAQAAADRATANASGGGW